MEGTRLDARHKSRLLLLLLLFLSHILQKLQIFQRLLVLDRKVVVSFLIELDLDLAALADVARGDDHLLLFADEQTFGLDVVEGKGERGCVAVC
jgi:hypothetical protein